MSPFNMASVIVLKPASALSPQRGESSPAPHLPSLCSLEQENVRLREDLSELRTRLQASSRTCPDQYQQALLHHAKTAPLQPAQDRCPPHKETHAQKIKKIQLYPTFSLSVTTGKRRQQRLSCSPALSAQERSRASSSSCTPCPRPPVPQTAGLLLQHPPLPPQDSPGETLCQVQMTLLLRNTDPALNALSPERSPHRLPLPW